MACKRWSRQEEGAVRHRSEEFAILLQITSSGPVYEAIYGAASADGPPCSSNREPQTVFSVCQPWASPLWLAARLLASGDVEANPGPPKNNSTKTINQPSTSTTTYICPICNKPITTRQYSLLCNHLQSPTHWVHKKCTSASIQNYHPAWTCPLHSHNQTSPTSSNSPTAPPPHSSKATHPHSQQIPPLAAGNPPPKTTSKMNKHLKILQLNINGIKNKSMELQQLMTEENIDIAVIQETKLHPSTKTPTIPNYSFTRHDRPIPTSTKSKTNGGGLITYIKKDLPYTNTASYTLPGVESQTITVPITKAKTL